MAEQQITRRLAAILAADVAGYSRMMGAGRGRHACRAAADLERDVQPRRRRAPWPHRQDDGRRRAGRIRQRRRCGRMRRRDPARDGRAQSRGGAADRVPHRHQSRRHCHRGRRHFRRRRQRRGAAGRPGAAGRHSCLRRRPRPGQRQGRRHLHRCRRNQAQEHRAAAAGVAVGRRRSAAGTQARRRFRPAAPADKPSIAVLPFAVMGSDPEQEFFADGLVEDILTTLRSSPACRSSPAIRASSTRGARWTCARSRESSACATCSKEASARPAIASASPRS